MVTKRFVDANILLRYLLQDDRALYEETRHYIEDGTDNSLILTPVIVAEVIYILLQKDYSKQQIADTVQTVLTFSTIDAEDGEAVSAAMRLFAARSLDFADCYILERSVSRGLQLATQDKKLQNARKARSDQPKNS